MQLRVLKESETTTTDTEYHIMHPTKDEEVFTVKRLENSPHFWQAYDCNNEPVLHAMRFRTDLFEELDVGWGIVDNNP